MLIKSSELLLQSQHSESRRHTVHESLVAGEVASGQGWSPEGLVNGVRLERSSGESHALFNQSRLMTAVARLESPPIAVEIDAPDIPVSLISTEVAKGAEITDKGEVDDLSSIDLMILRAFIKRITGREISIFVMNEPHAQEGQPDEVAQSWTRGSETEVNEQWGLRYRYSERAEEHEAMHFSTSGVIETSDGKRIEIEVALNMSRSFISQTEIAIDMGAARVKDPLVINLSGSAVELTQTMYEFDLDMDGTSDQIAFVAPGSGFLAHDLNHDGIINDGGELFGPSSGNGFTDLAQYDSDSNHWIDEADAIYDGLRIWTKDSNGTDRLIALGHAGIGAIYLGHTPTPFSLKDDANQAQGEVRSSGIYLKESGAAGVVQQVDLVV